MHAIKGGWVGQTFALAKKNESEGRKSRIRRSKEERKELVESFIKRHQKLHNGSFPSLNLTHKEVGGSFYTVRDIVRDVIQENRVLGPGKFTTEDQTIDQLSENSPLGSIAAEPQFTLASDGHSVTLERQISGHDQIINGTDAEVNNKDVKGKELQLNGPVETEKNVADESVVSDGDCNGSEYHMFNNGNQVDQKGEETKELAYVEHQKSVEENVEEVLATSRYKVSPIEADVIVETFPLQPVTRTTDSLEGKLEVKELIVSKEDKTKEMSLATGVDSSPLDGELSMKSKVGEKIALESPLVEIQSGSVDEEASEIVRDASLKSSDCSNLKDGIVDGKQSTQLNVKAPGDDVPISDSFEQSQGTTGTKTMKAQDTKILNGSSVPIPQTKDVLAIEDKVDNHSSTNLKKGSNPTLDRINLESWQRVSRMSKKREVEPLWAVLKEYLDAFVKFWSE